MNLLSKTTLATLLSLSLSPAMAYSLYDGAPPIGLPKSQAIHYSAHIGWGWDNNINSSSTDEESSLFSNFSLTASASNVEATTTYSYDARIGGTVYESDANNTTDTLFADCSLTANISHQINSRSSISSNLSLTYSPQPDYSSSISSTNIRGDVLNWDASLGYSYSIDSRWSLSANTSYSGNLYGDDQFSADDREYLTIGGGANYIYSTLTTYSLNASAQLDVRQAGPKSDSLYLTAELNTSLSPISSMSFSMGLQFKQISSEDNLYPTIDISYRRTLPEGMSLSFYISLDNENIDTYKGNSGTYLSDAAWRLGVTLSKTLTPRITASLSTSMNISSYSDATTQNGERLADQTSISVNISPSINYKISENLSTSLNYNFTHANKEAGDYYRGSISGSFNYSF